MVIRRSDLVDPKRLTRRFFDDNDPDIIGVEVMLDGHVLIIMTMDQDGQTSVLFDVDAGQFAFDLAQLTALFGQCDTDLSAWRQQLIQPGALWERTI